MQITKLDGIKIDESIELTGSEHQGYCRAYDRKTKKTGFVDLRTGYFHPDPDKDTGTGTEVHQSFSSVSNNYPDSGVSTEKLVLESVKDFGKGTLKALAVIIGGVAAVTYARECAKDPANGANATKKALRNAACMIGIIGVILAVIIIPFVFVGLTDILGSYTNLVLNIVLFVCGYTIFGLIRVMLDKTFFISVRKVIQKIRTTRVPVIAYVGIMLASIFFLFQPVMNFFDRLTMDWFEANKDSFTYIQKIVMAVGMAGGSLVLSALAGVVLCLIVKKMTAKA